MSIKATKTDVREFLKEGSKLIGYLAMKIYGESLNHIGEKAFSDAIEIGIENTVAALYDANVDDKDILRVVCEHWGIEKTEAEDRLVNEKFEAAVRSLKQYLKLQGYSQSEIDSFMRENMASAKIRYEKDLWKLKDSPEKLMKIIKNKN